MGASASLFGANTGTGSTGSRISMNAELHWELEDMRAYVDWNDMPGEVQRLTPQLNIPAQSLEMSGDELLFNLSYFNSGEISDTQLSRMYSTAVDEALAAHSPANSPFRLHPASRRSMELLKRSSSLGVEAVSDVSCTICREAFVNTDEIIVLPACQHAFHSSCVLKWLSLKNTCPVCRECVEHPVPTSAPLMKTVLSVELDKAESSSEMNAGVM